MPSGHQAAELVYSVRPRVLLKYLGQLLVVVAAVMLVPLAVSAGAAEWDRAVRLALVSGTLGITGGLLGRIRATQRVQSNETLVLAAGIFLLSPFGLAVTMMADGLGFVDALFESVSAVTTTGLSTLATVDDKSTGFLFSRAWAQWYGGLGIMVLSLALVTSPGLATRRLAVGEAEADDPVGGTKAHFRRVVLVYVMLTLAGWIVLALMGVGAGQSWYYVFCAVSTGGFAPDDASLGALGSWAVRGAVIALCVCGATSLVFYRRVYRDGLRPFVEDRQLHALVVLGVAVAIGLVALLRLQEDWSWGNAAGHGLVLAFSAQSTAGFASTSVEDLNATAKVGLMIAMFIGGGAGSTAGGLKILRLLVLLSLMRVVLIRTALPTHAVLEPRLGGKRVGQADITDAVCLLGLFLLVVVLSWLPFLFCGYDPLDSLFEVVSATGTVGLSSGVTGPALEPGLKLLLCADMLMGRLEILAWIVLLYPGTWLGRRGAST